MTKMFIPKRIKIGFQKREDTFTGKLSYIIYYDETNKLRKEASWNSWRDDSIETLEFDNVPQNGYIFNKGVQRDGYWGSGRSVIRVYDPRDFEFEISVDNLMGLLMHSDVSKRDILEKCIFAWDGKELVLLPVNSKEYEESVKYTEKQDKKVSSKDLVKGYIYQEKKSDIQLTYIGYYEWFEWKSGYYENGQMVKNYNRSYEGYIYTHESKGKKHVFFDGKEFIAKSVNNISEAISDSVVSNYSNLVDSFLKSTNGQKIVGFESFVNQEKLNKKEHHEYDVDLYFVDSKALMKLYVTSERVGLDKATGRYSNNFRIKLEEIILSYSYDGNIKVLRLNKQEQIAKYNNLKNKFNKVFSKEILVETNHDYDEIYKEIEKAKDWLLENGVVIDFLDILESGDKVIHQERFM